jgi:hypothetical protein
MYINNNPLINNPMHYSQLYHNEGEKCVSYNNNKLLYEFAIYITHALHAKKNSLVIFFFTLIRFIMQTQSSNLSAAIVYLKRQYLFAATFMISILYQS